MGGLRKRTALGVALALFVCRVPLPVTVALAEDMNEPTVIVQGVREGETSSVPVDSHYESTIPTEAPGEDGAPTEGSPETADPVVEDSAEEGPSGTSEAPEPGPSGDPAGGEGGVVPSPDDAVEDDDTGSVSSEGSAQSREDVLESEVTAVSAEESTEVTPPFRRARRRGQAVRHLSGTCLQHWLDVPGEGRRHFGHHGKKPWHGVP